MQVKVSISIPLRILQSNDRSSSPPPPQTNVKKDKKSLDDISVFTRLAKIGLEVFPIAVADEIKGFTVGRLLLSQHFGGASRGPFPHVKEERVQKHGFDNFMYANLVSTFTEGRRALTGNCKPPTYLTQRCLPDPSSTRTIDSRLTRSVDKLQ